MNLATAQRAQAEGSSGRRTIPFDYSFRFQLEGQPQTTHSQTVTVSIEASFTAVSIGYGAVPTVEPIRFGLLPPRIEQQPSPATTTLLLNSLSAAFNPKFAALAPSTIPAAVLAAPLAAPGGGAAAPAPGTTAASVSPVAGPPSPGLQQFAQRSFFMTTVAALADRLGEPLNPASNSAIGPRTASVLRNGIKLNPEVADRAVLALEGNAVDDESLAEAFQGVATPSGEIQFLYALSDQGTHREFQSEPVLSTAGLGASDGGRPFRYFARPIEFTPRSVIRMQITEVSDFTGELHVCLQGYKTLGGAGSPTAIEGRRRRRRIRS